MKKSTLWKQTTNIHRLGLAGVVVFACTLLIQVASPRVAQASTTYGYAGQFSLSEPWAIAISTSTGNVYVSNVSNNTVEIFSSSGTYISQFGERDRVTGNSTKLKASLSTAPGISTSLTSTTTESRNSLLRHRTFPRSVPANSNYRKASASMRAVISMWRTPAITASRSLTRPALTKARSAASAPAIASSTHRSASLRSQRPAWYMWPTSPITASRNSRPS